MDRRCCQILRSPFPLGLACLVCLLAGLWVWQGTAQEPPKGKDDGIQFFEKQIKPILAQNCFKCHSHAAKKNRGGLVVDSVGGLLKGGETGPAIVRGAPEKSLLLQAVHQKGELKMPPDARLADGQIDLLTRWIKMGAPGPVGDKTAKQVGKITDEDRAWWAFQPVKEPKVPALANQSWARNEVDHFILHKLQAEGLQPAPEADRRTLVRRVYFDVIGLPPSPKEVEAFVNDRSPQAYEKLVDQLLASPHYGERWARHWLDVVRYAESDGFRADEYRPSAWRYRDYVIRAFNKDMPYDRFILEQLAGDEIAPDKPEVLVATGFLRHTMYEFNQRDARTQWADTLNDLTDVTSDVFLGLGVGCARCHDHKFDPILQRDYFRMQAFFAPFLPRDDVPLATAQEQAAYKAKLAEWEKQTAAIRKKMDAMVASKMKVAEKGAIEKYPPDIQAMMRKPTAQRAPLEEQLHQLAFRQVTYEWDRIEAKLDKGEKKTYADFKKQLAAFDKIKPSLPLGLTVTDVGPLAPPTFIPKKGPQPIEPGFLTILDDKPAVIEKVPTAPNSTGRRTALAKWLTRPDHPLTTRVMVNRVWQYHFGHGLVATASDFGRLGEKPSHPELLDWLAARFVKDGWSLKKLHRLILTSATYRQSAIAPAPAEALRKDPENRLLWRAGTRRLEAEQIRDAMLAATGELNLAPGGEGVAPTSPRRTIYMKVLRNTRDPFLDVFDLPEGFVSTAERNVTTTATQALLLMNSKLMATRAQAFAKRLEKEAKGDDEAVTHAYRLAYGRAPTRGEREAAQLFLLEQASRVEQAGNREPRFTALVDFCHALLNSNEFLYVD